MGYIEVVQRPRRKEDVRAARLSEIAVEANAVLSPLEGQARSEDNTRGSFQDRVKGDEDRRFPDRDIVEREEVSATPSPSGH